MQKFLCALCIASGLLIAGSDGKFFPYVNVVGLIVLYLGMKILTTVE